MSKTGMNTASLAAMMSAMTLMNPSMGRFLRDRVEKEPKKCLLPICELQTKHNGGYCCADHCKQHRELQKQMKG